MDPPLSQNGLIKPTIGLEPMTPTLGMGGGAPPMDPPLSQLGSSSPPSDSNR
jgi:hypothetical protein